MNLEDLHAPYAALLRERLATLSPAGARVALDLGCGPGLKLGWLAERLAPGGLLVGIDIDRGALRAAAGWPAPPDAYQRPGAGDLTGGAPPAHVRPPTLLSAGDAHAIPLRSGSCDLVWCVATLGLLRDPAMALAEVRRVLRPGGALVVAVAGERWVRARVWPECLLEALRAAPRPLWERGLGEGDRASASEPMCPADGLGDDLRDQLAAAGLTVEPLRADLLDGPGAGRPTGLPLLAWPDLRPLAAHRLAAEEAAACAAAEDQAEPEVRPVLLTARAHLAGAGT